LAAPLPACGLEGRDGSVLFLNRCSTPSSHSSISSGLFTRDSVLIEAVNPKIGYPWASVGGQSHNFYEDESNDVRVDSEPTVLFHVERRADLSAAKDFYVTIHKV
jgi:hypothetical protein